MAETTINGLRIVGDVLRDQRRRRGWSLPVAARRVELPSPTLGSYERADRNPQIDVLVRILDVYDLRLVVTDNSRRARIRALREELERLEAMA